jgi:predicted RNA binding protein YcfA (HicA-like mRNA interferase family)
VSGQRLPRCSSKEICKVLEKAGFDPTPASGDHQAWKKREEGHTLVTIVLLGKKELNIGVVADIIRKAGLTREEFMRLLRGGDS